jgi:hypothetical protein
VLVSALVGQHHMHVSFDDVVGRIGTPPIDRHEVQTAGQLYHAQHECRHIERHSGHLQSTHTRAWSSVQPLLQPASAVAVSSVLGCSERQEKTGTSSSALTTRHRIEPDFCVATCLAYFNVGRT